MTKDVVTVTTDATVADAAKKMAENNTGTVVVTENGKARGLVIDRDIVIKAVGQGMDPNDVSVRNIMVDNLVTVKEDDYVFDFARLCAEKGPFRRCPVVNDNDEVVGVVSVADLTLIAHPLLEAILRESGSSVREADVEESDTKRDLRNMVPSMVGR